MSYIEDSINRITTLIKPTKEALRNFVLNKTYLNGRKFSFHNHEYQKIILDLSVEDDVDLVVFKVAQAGVSELIYRIKLARMGLIQGYPAAIILPSLEQVREVMKTRIDTIIAESPSLKELIDKSADSTTLKKFINGSILYALSGSGSSSSTTITRPIRDLVVDELARADMNVVTALASRQRHQLNKTTTYFSTPRFEGYDIDAEIKRCGTVYRFILPCTRCGHEFFPDFYKHVILPGYNGELEELTEQKIIKKDLDINEAYLACPKCGRRTEFGYPHTKMVDVGENKRLSKKGIMIMPFDMPAFVQPADLIKDMIRMKSRLEFEQQCLAIPTSAKKSTMDAQQIKFVHEEPTGLNIMAVDFGKISTVLIGCVKDGRVLVHYIEKVPAKTVRERVPELYKKFKVCTAVIDYMPFIELSTYFMRVLHNVWVATYSTQAKDVKLFTLKEEEESSLGKVKKVRINMHAAFDYAMSLMQSGVFVFRAGEWEKEVKDQMSVMRRIKDVKSGGYKWIKPGKIGEDEGADHIHHCAVYLMVASRMLDTARSIIIPSGSMIRGVKLKVDV